MTALDDLLRCTTKNSECREETCGSISLGLEKRRIEMKRSMVCGLVCVVLGMLGSGLYADTITLQTGLDGYAGTKDTYLRSDTPTTNNGTSIAIIVRDDSANTYISNSLIAFDLAGQLPAGAEVVSATLKLDYYRESGAKDYTYNLHRLLKGWAQNTATWNKLNSGTNWGSPGATGATDRDATPTVTLSGLGTPPTLVSFDVTADVENFVEGTKANYGWLLTGGGTVNANFLTSDYTEAGTGSTTRRPILEIEYIPEPTTMLLLLSGGVLGLIRRRK